MFRSLMPVLALSLLCSLGSVNLAQAQRAEAKAAFQKGVALYKAENYSSALESFREAYRLKPHPSVRVNMANCYDRMGLPVSAIDHFETYLAEVENASPAKIKEVKASLKRLRKQVGEVFFRVLPDGAAVVVDGVHSYRSPILDAIAFKSGAHEVVISKEGYQTITRQVQLSGAGRAEVTVQLRLKEPNTGVTQPISPDVNLEPEPHQPDIEPVVQDTTAPVQEEQVCTLACDDGYEIRGSSMEDCECVKESKSRITTPVIISGAIAVAFGAGSVISALLANQSESAFEAEVGPSNDPSIGRAAQLESRDRGLEAADKANRRALFADIFGGVAAAAIVTAVVFLIIGPKDDESEEAQAKKKGIEWSASAAVGRDSASMVLSGAF